MEKTTTIEVLGGEFTIKNELTVGEEIKISVRRATLSNGMYGQMMESPNFPEMTAGWKIFRTTELDGRIEKNPESFLGCTDLNSDDLDALWKEWTTKSGMFLDKRADGSGETGSGEEGTD